MYSSDVYNIFIVGVPTCKNGRVEQINTNLCCYISWWS